MIPRILFFLVFTAALTSGAISAEDRADEPPLKVVIAASKGQLSAFQKHLEDNYKVQCFVVDGIKEGAVVNTEVLEKCDVLLLNLYRTQPDEEALGRFKSYFKTKKGVVGLRKASHAFQNWLEADQEVLGVKYGGHFLLNKKDLEMQIEEKAKHRALLGDLKPFLPGGGLYSYTQLAPDVEVLLTGGQQGNMMPQSWVRITEGRRVFYTRYDPDDLKKDAACRQMVVNALFWAADRTVAKKTSP